MLPLGDIIHSYNINLHCYADDTQIYIPIKHNHHSELANLEKCLCAIKDWMSSIFLMLNAGMAEMYHSSIVKNLCDF